MNNNGTIDGSDGPGDLPGAEGVSQSGIEVDETIAIERIELGAMDFDESVVDEPTPYATVELESLEREQLRLAAELAELRSAAATRERMLEGDLAAARETITAQEAELTDQVAQIASLTLECSGLRSQLRSDDFPPAASVAVGSLGAHALHDDRDAISRMRERLEERARAIAVARAEAEELRAECMRLRTVVARQLVPAATPQQGEAGSGRFAGLRRLFSRVRGQPEPGQPATLAGVPGNEMPTLAIDPPRRAAAPRPSVQARVLQDERVDHLRRQNIDRALARAKNSRNRAHVRPALRRYLIALEPDRDEVLELSRPRMYVGRGAESDLRLSDATVSRLHGVVSLQGGETVVEDASSTNGLFINAQRVRRAALKDGDTVTFGTVRYQYRIGPLPSQTN